MKETLSHGFVANAEFFSIATQIYVRLRRVTGRVVDAMYLVQNRDYAQHVIHLALESGDAELKRHVERLRPLFEQMPESTAQEAPIVMTVANEKEVTPEEIYRAQVHHHYIGALR